MYRQIEKSLGISQYPFIFQVEEVVDNLSSNSLTDYESLSVLYYPLV